MCQNWMKLGANPDRPASPRPAGLAPSHTLPRLQSRCKVTWVQCLWVVDWMSVWSNGLKGLYMDQRTHNSVQTRVQVSNSTPRVDHKRWSATSAQHPGLIAQAGWPSMCVCSFQATYTDTGKRSEMSRRRRWPHGHTPRPAGPIWQPLNLFAWKTSTPTSTAYN